jgi:hypothetical protein
MSSTISASKRWDEEREGVGRPFSRESRRSQRTQRRKNVRSERERLTDPSGDDPAFRIPNIPRLFDRPDDLDGLSNREYGLVTLPLGPLFERCEFPLGMELSRVPLQVARWGDRGREMGDRRRGGSGRREGGSRNGAVDCDDADSVVDCGQDASSASCLPPPVFLFQTSDAPN